MRKLFADARGAQSQTESAKAVPPHHAADDFNGDGTSDLILRDAGGWVVDWILTNGTYQTGHLLGPADQIARGDINADGTTDIVTFDGGTVRTWVMGNGTVQGSRTVSGAPPTSFLASLLGAADVSNDGSDDLLFLTTDSKLVDWRMIGGDFNIGQWVGSVGPYFPIAAGDFNGDGMNDILLRDNLGSGGNIVDWILNYDTVKEGHVIATGLSADWHIVGTGDFDADGTTDILLQNGGTVVEWLMAGGNFKEGRVVTTGADGWNVAAIGDYNGDGTSDIALQNGNAIVAWFMHAGAYQSGVLVSANANGWSVQGNVWRGPNGS